jgi:hypothetical protein
MPRVKPLKPVEDPPRVEKQQGDLQDIEYAHRQSDESEDLLNSHESIETILEEEEGMLKTH